VAFYLSSRRNSWLRQSEFVARKKTSVRENGAVDSGKHCGEDHTAEAIGALGGSETHQGKAGKPAEIGAFTSRLARGG